MSSLTIPTDRHKSIKVLMVEDSHADVVLTQSVFSKMMVNLDMNITTDGRKALNYLNTCLESNDSTLPDLVILDLNLPEMNGLELLREIRQTPAFKSLNVAILSTSNDHGDLKEAKELNVLCCMSKPAREEELNSLIDQFYANTNCPEELADDLTSLAQRFTGRDTVFDMPGVASSYEDSEEGTTEEIKISREVKTVLLIEDNLADVKLISKRLSMEFPEEFQIVHKASLKEALTFLENVKVDVITLDLGLPDAVGMEAFESINAITIETPIVVLTGVNDSSYALEAVKQGAQDYLVKDAKKYGDVLGRVLRYAIERKKVERVVQHSLKLEQNTLREVLDEAPLHILRIDSKLRIRDVNPMVVNTTKLPEAEILGREITSIFPDLEKQKLEELVNAGLTYNSQQLKVTRIGRAYFNNYYLDIVGWPTQRALTEEKEAIIICTDVSERVRLASQRDEFIAALAHDIRNPLIGELRVLNGIISGALGMIGPPVKSALESVTKSNSSLLLMLTNMLEVYELEASGTTLHLEEMELKHLVKDVVSEMNYLTMGTSIELEFQEMDEDTSIEGDETALRRVVQNLSYNAVKFASANSKISISVSRDDNENVLLRVYNQGPKIKEEEKLHLFNRFTKASLGRRYMHSSGLGLYLCKKIVEGHSGVIGCTSDDNGTTFLVSIPAADIIDSKK